MPNRSSSGAAPRVNSTADRDVVPGVRSRSVSRRRRWWLRCTPGCSVITRPSSTDIRAISTSMWRRSAVASAGVAVAVPRGRGVDPASPRAGVERQRHDVARGCGRPTRHRARRSSDGGPPAREVPGVGPRVDVRDAARAPSPAAGKSATGRLEVRVGPEGGQHPRATRRVRRPAARGARRSSQRVVGGREDAIRNRSTAPAAGTRRRPGTRRSGRRSRPRSARTAGRRRRRSRRARSPASTVPAVPRNAGQCSHSSRQARRDARSVQAGRHRPRGLQRDARGVQQPGDVVVRRDEQRRRVGERRVLAPATAPGT